jgi:hypothetical protein
MVCVSLRIDGRVGWQVRPERFNKALEKGQIPLAL